MIKVVVGGQIDKKEIAADILDFSNDEIQVDIKSDLEAAMEMKKGSYDYYIGACNTGGGGALAMAIAMLGPEKCSTVSMPGSIKSREFILEEFDKGKVAFGFTAQHRESVLPILVTEIIRRKGE